MNSLFWKFFVAFWLGLVLFSSATFWFASSYLEQSSASPGRESLRTHYLEYLQAARYFARQQGEDGLKRWLRQLDYKEATPYYMVDASGDELLDRDLPEHLLLQLERENRRPELNRDTARRDRRLPHQRKPFQNGMVVLPGWEKLRLVADPRGITLARISKRPRVIALPLIIAAISSALVCLFLARYLVRPINRLQDATHRVAKGDFELSVAKDLNNRKDEIGDLARDFDFMTAQLQGLIESQRQLLSDVSHELCSPLARLQAALGLLQKRLIDMSAPDWSVDARLKALQRIEQEAEKMSELITQILSLSRLDAKSAELKTEATDLVELLQVIVEDANFEASQHRVVLLDAPTRVVQSHRKLLSSAIENVIRNALKYSPETAPIEIKLKNHNTYSDIRIYDHGSGVSEDQLEIIFEPFTRLDEARRSDLGGHGIGLALARKVMQKHGGSITAHNRASGGLCVKLRLPCVYPASISSTTKDKSEF